MSWIVGRRELILGGVGLALAPGMALAAPPPRLAFQVFRNGNKVGEHIMTFVGDDRNRTVTANVAMIIQADRRGSTCRPSACRSALKAVRSSPANAKLLLVRSSRVGNGRVIALTGLQQEYDALDVIPADNLSPQKARVLLMLALTTGTSSATRLSRLTSNPLHTFRAFGRWW